MRVEKVAIKKVKPNPDNPRVIKGDQFKRLVKSLQEFPAMLELREVVVDDDYMVLGGNMRLRALQEIGEKEIIVKVAEGLTPEQKREFIVKDNAAFGAWDFEQLATGWGDLPLADWGVDLPGFGIEEVNPPELADGDRAPFQQMTFTLHDEQAEDVKAAIDAAKKAGCQSAVNENSNGNALAYICQRFNRG